MSHQTILYDTDGPIATVTLNRPERLNTIVPPMPEEFRDAIVHATRDETVKVVVVRGAGRSFCAGYDFDEGWEDWHEQLTTDGAWDPGKDFVSDADRWMRTVADEGVGAAIRDRDAPFADYSQAPPDDQPDPQHVIEP